MSWLYAAASAAGIAISALVFFARPGRLQNRLLALALLFEVFAQVRTAVFHGLPAGALGPGLVHALNTVLWFAVWGLSAAYLAFLGTVDTRWSRPLDSRRARIVLAGVVGLVWTVRLAWPVLTEAVSVNYVAGAVGLYGLLVAATYWRSTEPGTLRRRQAKAYAAAFGVRDLLFVLLAAFTVPLVLGAEPTMLLGDPLHLWFPAIGTILFAPLAAYGILTTQLFDIDLKVKWTLEKGTIAAVFVAVFFVVSEGAQIVFADFAGSEILGVLAAGALVFLLSPLQRLAERVGDAAMPEVEDTEAYRQHRKMQVYEETLRDLLEDDEITDRDRIVLDRLRDEMELGQVAADRLEADVREEMGVAGS